MYQKKATKQSDGSDRFAVPEALADTDAALASFLPAATFGLAIFDNQFRFSAINDALAAINGVPAETHLGKTPRAILGKAAAKIEPVFEHVLMTGESVSNFEFSAQLPRRTELGHWIVDYFPLSKDPTGRVRKVAALVVEVTKNRKMESSIGSLRSKLLHLNAVLTFTMNQLSRSQRVRDQGREVLIQSVDLLKRSMLDAREIFGLLQLPEVLNRTEALRLDQFEFSDHLARPLSVAGSSDPLHRTEQSARPLSPREREIVRLLAESKCNKEVAQLLSISIRTVESHRARIMLKLGLHSVAELVLYAVRNEIIET